MTHSSGPILPSADTLNDYEHGKFVLSNLAAKRAKQLKEGAAPLVRIDSNHPLSIALAEIAAGKIRPILGADEPEMAVVEADIDAIHETVPGELGILLPALDDAEAEAEGLGVRGLLGDADHEDEHEHDHDPEVVAADAGSLLETLGGDDAEPEVEPVAVEGEDETLSLSDIADKENVDDEPHEDE